MTGELIAIEKPQISKIEWDNALELGQSVAGIMAYGPYILKAERPRYLAWNEFKRKDWIPEDPGAKTLWAYIKLHRLRNSLFSPVVDHETKALFHWNILRHYPALFHEIDLNMGGRLLGADFVSDKERDTHIRYSLIEEAIASAQLEGAHTTREQARKMIREGKTPADRSQRMIYNNYKTIMRIEEELKDHPLSFDLLCELQAALTQHTMDDDYKPGALRKDEDNIVIASHDGSQIAHIPPAMAFVKEQLEKLIKYANDEPDGVQFTHPLIKAIILHFWIGYLHPFPDGNGRLARALFYWYMLRKGYWAFAFIPVSTRIKKSPKQYVEAYIYSEQDDNDLTYFIDYNLRQIELARADFLKFMEQRRQKKDNTATVARRLPGLNDRQVRTVDYLLAHPKERTNVTAIQQLYGVTAATAVKDLKKLWEDGYLRRQKQGKNVFYYPTEKLLKLLDE